jgi:iron(III) transport system ATP-binding protein
VSEVVVPERPAPYLEVRGLSKRFGPFTALEDVDLDVYPGEFVSFLGPSGCGKTTLLRAISGLDVQTAGSIRQAGRDISDLPVSKRDFGIVFQSYALFPNLTIADNVGYGLVSTGRPRAEIAKRVAELLALVGLAEQARKYPAQLSGGQQQRIALARAIALSSRDVLLIDEPLSALDATGDLREHLAARDQATCSERLGITTIYGDARPGGGADDVRPRRRVECRGRIEQVANARASSTPVRRAAFVAGFVGKMNFLKGRLTAPDRAEVAGAHLTLAEGVGVGPGAPVTVCLRPEDIVVRAVDADRPNRLAMQVGVMEFIGNHFSTTLHAVGTSLNLSADLSINDVRDLSISPGSTITVTLPPERLRVFAEPPAAGH